MTDIDPVHAKWMRRALVLAARYQGFVEPNPMVGCVLVKSGKIVGQGAHRKFGGPHAEVFALRQAGRAARGATAYVTLEPCSHVGKTPPCADALIKAGIGEVVAAQRDPNPLVAGRGLERLRKAGIPVSVGLLADEARQLNAPFLRFITQRRPWVIAKWAQSVDGKIATSTGDTRWISNAAQRKHAHIVRGRVDAILVGIGTVLTDDPLLTCRDAPLRRTATRIVLDRAARTPLKSQLVQTAQQAPTVVLCGRSAPARRLARLRGAGVDVQPLLSSDAQRNWDPILRWAGERGMTNVLVEGGGVTLGSLLDAAKADEVHIYSAPLLIGGLAAPGPWQGRGSATLARAARLAVLESRRLGDGWFVRGHIASLID